MAQRIVSVERWLDAVGDRRRPPRFEVFARTTVPGHWRFVDRAVPEHLIYHVMERELAGQACGERFILGPGDLCWLAPGVRHTFANADTRRPITLYHMRPIVVSGGAVLRLRQSMIRLTGAWELRPMFEQLHDEVTTRREHRLRRIAAGMELLFSAIFRLQRTGPGRAGQTLGSAQRRVIYDLAQERMGMGLTPTDLAEAVGLSPDYFTRVFRATFGRPPRRWLLEQRIGRAAVMLDETTDPITSVARALGYADVFLFSRQFKQVMGRGPRAYRRR